MDEQPLTSSKAVFGGGRKMLARVIVIAAVVTVSLIAAAMFADASRQGPPSAAYFIIVFCGFAALLGCIAWFVSSLFSWKNFRRFLFGLACVLTLILVVLVEENVRGKMAWRNELQRLQARGEGVDPKDFIPSRISDDKNLSMIPLLKPLFDFQPSPAGSMVWGDTNGLSRLNNMSIDASANGKSRSELETGSLEKDTFADIEKCAAFYLGNTNYPQAPDNASSAQIVLTALSKYDREMQQLQEGCNSRPGCEFPIHYDTQPPWAILLPHLAVLRNFGRIAEVRGLAEIAATNSDAAARDFFLGLRLSDGVGREPCLVSHLVRIASLGTDLMIVREGLGRHAWTPAQLDAFERALGTVNLLSEYRNSMAGERAIAIGGLDYMRRQGSRFDPNTVLSDNNNGNGLLKFLPSGWIYQNMALMAKMHEDYTLPTVDPAQHRLYPDTAAAGAKAVLHLGRSPNTIFVRMLMPALEKAAIHTGRSQTHLDECRVACALEKYRIENGSFPDDLQKLAPKYLDTLPSDVIDGKPLRYRKEADGGYIIYSVGWNQKDDGGTVALKKTKSGASENSHGSVDGAEGDWVWRMPASLAKS